MSLRYLFGPVPAAFADQNLRADRQAGHCLAFDHAGATDIAITARDRWDDVMARLPAGWRPDFVAVWLAGSVVPECVWSAPLPLVGLAPDWDLLWHGYRYLLPRCDRVLTDPRGVEVMHRAGFTQSRPATLCGLGPAALEESDAEGERDIDVLSLSEANPAVERERLPWLARLARLAERWRILIQPHRPDSPGHDLPRRARIVFHRSLHGALDHIAFAALAAGALLFLEADNREASRYLRDRQEVVLYTADNLETLLEHYLRHEEERRAIAAAGRRCAERLRFAACWEEQVAQLAVEGLDGQAQAARESATDWPARVWQVLNSPRVDDALLADFNAILANEATPSTGAAAAARLEALALVAAREDGPLPAAVAHQVVERFERAVRCAPDDVLAGLNLAEALLGAGAEEKAVAQARRALAVLDRLPEDCPSRSPDFGHFPPGIDLFRVEWEKTAWGHAGDPAGEARAKQELLRWRLHTLLADLTGEPAHFYAAALARPDLPNTRAALGCALARAGRLTEALPHLRFAVTRQPFDLAAVRALHQALGDTGEQAAQRDLAAGRRLLARAAPQLVPPEPWFAGPAGSVNQGPPPSAPLAIVWEGDQLALHSMAQANREICRRLLAHGHDLALLNAEGAADHGADGSDVRILADRFRRPLAGPVDVHVGFRWPPNLTPPPAGHWVVMQPWEFGSLPADWLPALAEQVDEVWAPTRFVRDGFVASGVPAERVRVIPLGVDPARFHPEVPPTPLTLAKAFKFLFVGGTVHRKGIDILLQAFASTFGPDEDIGLVIKDMEGDTFYRGQRHEAMIARYQAAGVAVEYIDRPLSAAEMAGLYTACDCLVHPYRGEGFGLPIAEAMACGLPVLVTGCGAALDFCDDTTAYLIPAREVHLAENRLGDVVTVGRPWLAEPDATALATLLRHVVQHPEEARAKGRAASAHVRQHFTWDQTVRAIEDRLRALRQRPVRRFHQGDAGPRAAEGAKGPARVSLCLIVRDEADNLPACLAGMRELVHEIIVADTGSTDATREVAADLGARVVDSPWQDSFAAARNASLEQASGDWIFWLDADDRLDDANRARLARLFAGLTDENAAYVMKCRCAPDEPGGTVTVVDHVRLFRNDPRLRWTYRVHEQILPALRQVGAEVRWADLIIEHHGYADRALRRRKLERDLRLLRLEDAERPDDPFTLFNLGSVCVELGQYQEALPRLRRSLERSHPQDSIVRKLYALITHCHRDQGQADLALAACREGRGYYPDDAELLYLEAILLGERGDLAGAEGCLLRLLGTRPTPHFASVDAGLRGYKGRHRLALLYHLQRRYPEAEAQWRLAIDQCPAYLPAWLGLGETALARGDRDLLESVARQIEGLPGGRLEADLLRGRWLLLREEWAAARQLAERVAADYPQEVRPRVLLSRALLREGLDLAAAEEALRSVLALDPHHPEARQNLQALSRQRQAIAAPTAGGIDV